ncbi:hypothetical protein RHSIM_Rhsim12G0044500 [Rhododendron simsii]|uniref:Transmembrane protein n=1 Tax=Rhododendron simsii TaxID=118357 RepID=A0A834L837_RHOSS|nr:hypothetical protein RHSIM_Rhsim12G0044500 [Rhododendron simsii]
MSTAQPVVQEQPVVQVYPNSVNSNQPSSHSSNGSFGSVFIVLAVIVVISAIACFLGRLCNKRYKKSQPKDKKSHGSKHKDTKSKNAVHGRDNDIEFGFENAGFNPAAKQIGKGGAKGFKPGGNGENRGEQMFAGEWEGKAGQY